jgi:ribonucleoside-diphosphate reductase alpha chain
MSENQKFFAGPYEEFIFLRTYSRWDDEKGRREMWPETVERYMKFMKENVGKKFSEKDYQDIHNAILNLRVMPSMRLLWASGEAARKNNASAYNCSYTPIDSLRRFREILFLLTSGCGVGFSVESKFVNLLPVIEKQTDNKLPVFVIPDSREGWADALHAGITAWYDGNDIEFDYSKIRPLGSKLKTFGGRASGPDPLRALLEFSRSVILAAQGRKLRPIEVHDIATKIAEVVVAGGTRRSSEISLSDLHDEEMRLAKSGNFYDKALHRVMANNSVAYETKPTQNEFMREWLALMESGSGERGIFNRGGAFAMMPDRRKEKTSEEVAGGIGCNPCAEIVLRPMQFCNLTSVVCRPEDTEESLIEKVRVATILGTYQSSLTDFPYLTKGWKDNCDEERLLGVSLNGQQDSKAVQNAQTLQKMRETAVETNKEYAKKLGIAQSTAITTTKPEGTGSQMLSCSSGVHPRYAQYYIRRVRISSSDPLFRLMKEQGVPFFPEVGQQADTATTFVLEFPIKSPKGAKTRHDMDAIEQLEYWKLIKTNYAEHTVSITVYVGKDEWLRVGNWVWDNWDYVTGISFLPKEDGDHVYQLAPYEEITKEQYEELAKKFPTIDFSVLSQYEMDDATQGAKEAACVAGACELV